MQLPTRPRNTVFYSLLAMTLASAANAAPVTIDLSAEASRPAINDLARATLFAEATSAAPGDTANRVEHADRRSIEDGARQSAGQGTERRQPLIRSMPRAAGSSWRMRSELVLESTDTTALSDLVGACRRRSALPASA